MTAHLLISAASLASTQQKMKIDHKMSTYEVRAASVTLYAAVYSFKLTVYYRKSKWPTLEETITFIKGLDLVWPNKTTVTIA